MEDVMFMSELENEIAAYIAALDSEIKSTVKRYKRKLEKRRNELSPAF